MSVVVFLLSGFLLLMVFESLCNRLLKFFWVMIGFVRKILVVRVMISFKRMWRLCIGLGVGDKVFDDFL